MEQLLVPYQAATKLEAASVLVLAPHPDDEVFGCGGAIMRHVADGHAVQVIILSDGAYRADKDQQTSYASLRRSESIQAAGVLGYGNPQFWGLPDRKIEYGEFLVQRIEQAIEETQADLIYAPSIYEMHPDHRALGMAALEAVRRNSGKLKLAMYEVGVPMLRPNLLLDISDLRDRKQQAMACFVSQLKEQAYDQHIAALNKFRTYTLGAKVTAAEAYFVANAQALKSDILKLYESEHQQQQELGLALTPADVPLVSVLIRSMDRITIKAALDSVALQTYSHIEVIVVNAKGGKHTDLGSWCGRFPLRLIGNSHASPRSQAANAAMKDAKGKYLIFLDDDDWFAPHHVSALMEEIRKNPDVRAAHSNIRVIGALGNFEDHVFRERFDPIRMMADNFIPIHSVLFERRLLEAGCLFDERLSVYEDWDFWLQVSRHTRFAHVDEVGAYYCASGTSDVGLQGTDDARRLARELIFDKWKQVWSGREINALLAHKDFLKATKVHELEWSLQVLKDQTSAEIQAQKDQLSLHVNTFEEQSKKQSETLVRQKNLTELLNQDLLQSELQTVALKGGIEELLASRSWRITAPLRWTAIRAAHARHVLALGRRYAAINGGGVRGIGKLASAGTATLVKHGPFKLIEKIRAHAAATALAPEIHQAQQGAEGILQPENNSRDLFSTNMTNSRSSTLKRRGAHMLKILFHKLPVSRKSKYRLRDFCYKNFPALFRNLPSYQFWLTRGAMGGPSFSSNSEALTSAMDWNMMLPATEQNAVKSPILPGSMEIDIIVPIYRGLEQTRRCIESVLNSTIKVPFRLILINDESPEIEVSNYLKELRSLPGVTLIENAENLGFTATVNLGMSLSTANDVVLLNSDTEVANDWLDRLLVHAYGTARVGTVTPFSSNATICNYPTLEGMKILPQGESTQSFDAAFAVANRGRHIDIPTAVGFCMYIRRDCLDEVGLFDVETFGKGYGEENDFCLRASALGWKHLLAADTFVFHEGEVSFQAGSNPRKERAMEILRGRYPSYETIVAEHVMLNEAHPLRIAATASRFKQGSLPVVLHVLHGHGGGTEKHVVELCRSFAGTSRMLIMNALLNGGSQPEVRLRSAAAQDGLDLRLPASNVSFLISLLQSFGVSLVHIHHVLDYPFDLRLLIDSLHVPFYLTVHDYFLICPRINLMPPQQKYCGEPEPSQCNQCLSINAPQGSVDIVWWRSQHAWLFEEAAVVICPSRDVATRCKRYFPDAAYRAVSHEKMAPDAFDNVKAPALTKGEPLRVAILGVLARHKGLKLISEALAIANKTASPLELRLIGFAENNVSSVAANLFSQTGPYQDADLGQLIEEFNPHLILFPACWPETYSYTLTEALKSNRPIMATHIGAFPERLTGRRWTWLIDWDISGGELVQKLEIVRSNNFEVAVSPAPPKSAAPQSSIVVTNDFYDKEYLAFKSERQTVAGIIDIRTPGKISVMVLLENAGDQPSPCAYIRLILPLLREPGRQLKLRWVTAVDIELYRADVLITQRTAVTVAASIDRIVAHCRKNHIRLVYDLDDFLLQLPADHPEQAVYAPKSAAVSRWLTESDEVWVSTDALRERVAALNPRVRTVKNFLDEQLWIKSEPVGNPDVAGRRLRLLYMGTQTHQADFELIKNALQQIKKEFSNELDIFLIGVTSNSSNEKWYETIVPPSTVGSSYPAFVNWITQCAPFDIGVTPLVDNEFNRCKSAIKFLDYSALGMVTLASDLGVYAPIRDGENGFLVANTKEAWYRALKTVLTDLPLLERVRQVAQREVYEFHGFESVSGERTDFLASLMNEPEQENERKLEAADPAQQVRLV
ncbi:MAG: glycosyltransferase [Polaromonas sp.]